jgi:hypothetical protein
MMMSSRMVMAVFAVFAAFATLAAAPALARVQWTPSHSRDACRPDVREALLAGSDNVEGFDHPRSGFGRLPSDIVIECLGDHLTQGAF